MERIHFIGIGGIGISAIARMYLGEGKIVSGSDQSHSPVTTELSKLGATIYEGHRASHLNSNLDLVIHTIAISADNPELQEAKRLGLKILTYPEALGRISAEKYTIAVAGTHGKTTTTAMIAKIFVTAGLDPTVIVGSFLSGLKSNFISGRSKYFITEACEYRRSFLNLSPKVVVITNIDNDHLDYFRDLADIQSAFSELVAKLPPDGYLVCDTSQANLAPIVAQASCRVVDYSTQDISGLQLQIPGAHNLTNAQAALVVARAEGLADANASSALNDFQGTWRRFEYRGRTKTGGVIYDDYAHHPTAVRATLVTAREIASGKVVVVFQPHLYSRTKLLLDDFAHSFSQADEVLVLPIYAAREALDNSINSAMLAERINQTGTPAQALDSFADVVKYLSSQITDGDVIITMGAGDIGSLADNLLS